MKKELFEELLESVKQGRAIMKGVMKPSRIVSARSATKHFMWRQEETPDSTVN